MKTETGWKRLLFVHGDDDSLGFFMFPKYYNMALMLTSAMYGDGTWQRFWDSLDSECREFIEPFMECDETKPQPNDAIDELGEMFIFSDTEFPMTQFAELTYSEVKSYLPLDLMELELRTEYHEFIGLFPIEKFDAIQPHLDKAGFEVDKVRSLVLLDLRNY